jgi:hypothetical protein
MENETNKTVSEAKAASLKISTHSLADAPLLRPGQAAGKATSVPQAAGGQSGPQSSSDASGGSSQGGGDGK